MLVQHHQDAVHGRVLFYFCFCVCTVRGDNDAGSGVVMLLVFSDGGFEWLGADG